MPNSELFALDVDLVVQLLSSFEGKQIYPAPKTQTKAKVFQTATTAVHTNPNQGQVPDGTYILKQKIKAIHKTLKAYMNVVGGKYIVPANTEVCLVEGVGLSPGVKQLRDLYVNENGISTEDVEFSSPSGAGSFVTGKSCNGWEAWRTDQGVPISVFRQGDD